jgi:hypothetical protein
MAVIGVENASELFLPNDLKPDNSSDLRYMMCIVKRKAKIRKPNQQEPV